MRHHFVKRAVGSALAVVLAASGSALLAAPASATTTYDIVALGDSYGSGTGAGDYLDGTGVADGCWRSANSYSQQVAAQVRPTSRHQVSFRNVTCSGAKTGDLRQTFKGQPPQLDALRTHTNLVLLSIGPNDIDYAGYAAQCVLADCSGPASDAMFDKLLGMHANVVTLLDEIKTRSPQAEIVLTGYGSQLTSGANAPGVVLDPLCGAEFFTSLERAEGNLVAQNIEAVLRQVAREEGVGYVSPYGEDYELDPAFAGRSLCESTEPYYRGFDALAAGQEGLEAVLHPNAAGHAALAGLVLAHLGR